MSSPVITPAAPAAAPAPAAASPSPVSSPSPAAASTPVTPSPATPSPAAPVEMTSEQRQAAMVAHLAETQGAKPPVPAVETPKVDETPKVETPKVDDKVDDKGADATQDVDDSFLLAEDSFAGARDLATEIDAIAGLKELLPKETRDKIMANARIAERLAPYEQIFTSPEEAKVIAETANEHAGFAEAFNLVNRDKIKGTDALVAKFYEASALRDAEGNIRKAANGNILMDGSADRFFDSIGERYLTLRILKKVEALKDENVTAALDLVMESAGLRPSTAAQDQSADPALAARKAELDAREAKINADRNTAHTEAQNAHSKAFETASDTLFETSLTSLLGQATALTSLEQGAVKGQIEAAFRAALKRGHPASVAYYRQLDRIRQSPISADRLKKETAEAAKFVREKLVTLSRPIFKEAGVVVGQKAEERAAAQAARVEATRSEVGGGRAPSAAATGPGDAAQQEARAVEAFKAANGGRAPSGESEMRIGMMLAHAKARGIAA